MSAVGYSCVTEAAVALVAATAKSVLGVKAHANSGLQVKGFTISFDGVTASAVPVLIELAYCTFGTNSPGTNSTNLTENQCYGRVLAAGFTGAYNWTAEPTTITGCKRFLLAPDKGVFAYQYPLGTEPDCALAEGFVLRITAPAAVNCQASIDVERI